MEKKSWTLHLSHPKLLIFSWQAGLSLTDHLQEKVVLKEQERNVGGRWVLLLATTDITLQITPSHPTAVQRFSSRSSQVFGCAAITFRGQNTHNFNA